MKCRMCKEEAVKGKTCCAHHLEYNSNREKNYRVGRSANRRLSNLCPRCGSPVNNRRTYCGTCLQDQREFRAARIAAGSCTGCSKPAKIGHTMCPRCLMKMKSCSSAIWNRRTKSGVCGKCGITPLVDERQICQPCCDRDKLRRRTLVESGICPRCGSRPILRACTSCEVCWYKDKAGIHLGDRKKWEDLKSIFESQNGICKCTGLPMTLGMDASVDHIIPVTRGGSLDLSNLQFVIEWYNLLKSNHLPEEFADKIRIVYANL